MNQRAPIYFALFMLGSCDAPYTVELPDSESQLVLNLVAEDGKKWHASLSKSKDILDFNLTPFPAIPDGTVSIYEGGTLLEELKFIDNPDLDDYYEGELSFPIPGKTYMVQATAPLMQVVTGVYTHPAAIEVEAFSVELLGRQASSNSQRMKFQVTFTDPKGSNYYTLNIRQQSDGSPFPTNVRNLILLFSNPAYEENKRVFRESIAFDDALFQDQRVTLEFESVLTYPGGETLEDLSYFRVLLENMSEALFDHIKTSYIQELTRDDPFAQPVIVTSNIANGLGIVGGLTLSEKTTQFK